MPHPTDHEFTGLAQSLDYPSMVPEDKLVADPYNSDQQLVDLSNKAGAGYVFPGQAADATFACRSILQSLVNLLAELFGDMEAALKARAIAAAPRGRR